MKDDSGDRKAYEKPQMSVMRINRFFFGSCMELWPNCYSQYMFVSGAASCR
ncbi:MAG: hypothetical protein PHP28_10455 [Actinomycetota bacterium]|nr:hypothetical protein [Actinomycetota bacterium]MDD5666694.1 hypothetical protein [Actinomycetota bacterium]